MRALDSSKNGFLLFHQIAGRFLMLAGYGVVVVAATLAFQNGFDVSPGSKFGLPIHLPIIGFALLAAGHTLVATGR